VHDGRAVVPQGGGVTQESVDCDLGGHSDVGQVHRTRRPLGDVQQPLAGRVSLKEIGKLWK